MHGLIEYCHYIRHPGLIFRLSGKMKPEFNNQYKISPSKSERVKFNYVSFIVNGLQELYYQMWCSSVEELQPLFLGKKNADNN